MKLKVCCKIVLVDKKFLGKTEPCDLNKYSGTPI
jgi:hypothetical protein